MRRTIAPRRIPWAIDAAGKLWLTQARPITTLFPLPAGARPEDLRVYFCFSVAQGLYRPITPMGLAGFRALSSTAARQIGIRVDNPLDGAPVYAEAGQRLFIDLTGILRGRVGRTPMPRLLDVMESRSAAILRGLFDEPRLSITRRSPLLFLRRVLRIAGQHRVPLQGIQALARPEAARARIERLGISLGRRLTLGAGASRFERLDFAERVLGPEIVPVATRTMPAAVAGLAMLGLAGRLLGDDARPGELETVLRGLPHNVTTEMDLALWNLAGAIRKDEAAAQAWRANSPAELARQYHRSALPGAVGAHPVLGFAVSRAERASPRLFSTAIAIAWSRVNVSPVSCWP